ncbi:Transcription elongation factor GreA OS=Streptomyces tendae OX=1932 GN=greA PE=3 SV=1 [Streptomyces tendae]
MYSQYQRGGTRDPRPSENVTWLTQEAYNKLKEELEYLTGPARHRDLLPKIAAAREEAATCVRTPGYHAANARSQGKPGAPRAPARPSCCESAKVGEAPAADGVVAPGIVVTIAFETVDEDDTLTFHARLARVRELGCETYSPQSPLGSGVIGHKVGDDAQYELPNGKRGLGEDPSRHEP